MSDPTSLARLAPGETACVRELRLGGDVARLLDALGIVPGVALTVLRRGVFGGPLHVRVESGAEFALGRELAAEVLVVGAPR